MKATRLLLSVSFLTSVIASVLTLPLSNVAQARNAPMTCAIQSYDGHYLTAVGGGGRTTDVIHTNATQIGSWEKFTLIDPGVGEPIPYGIQTSNGHYLTAVGGGGRITDVIHSDATQYQDWEKFTLIALGGGVYAIQTFDKHYLTAVNSGGLDSSVTPDVMHTDATRIGTWEQFRLDCPV